MARTRKLDLAKAKSNTGSSSTTRSAFTKEWLMSHGVSARQAAESVRTYKSQPTTGLKASYRKEINDQLGLAPSKSEIAEKAKKTRAAKNGKKAGNGKGSAKRSEAAKKAAATRRANAEAKASG